MGVPRCLAALQTVTQEAMARLESKRLEMNLRFPRRGVGKSFLIAVSTRCQCASAVRRLRRPNRRRMTRVMESVNAGLSELAIMRGMGCCDGVEELASVILAAIDGVREARTAEESLSKRAAMIDARVRALRRRRATRMVRS